MPHISILSPVYYGEKILPELVSGIKKNVSTITDDYEIILVDDGSPDESWLAIQKECAEDKRVKGVNLSRNFGQHRAIASGLQYVTGEWVVVMDCDLQDRFEEIPNLYNKAQEGYDIVLARREERKDGFFKKLSSRFFYSVLAFLSGSKLDNRVSNFGIYNKIVIETVRKMPERDWMFPIQVNYAGFKSVSISVNHGHRNEGHSSYSLLKLLKLAFGVLISNSNKPLKVMVVFGGILSFTSLLIAVYNVIAYFAGLITLAGYTTTVFSIWFVGGILIMQVGILGIYVGKIFDQVKGRPRFVVKEVINL